MYIISIYSNNSSYLNAYCLSSGAYNFNWFDTWGDGWNGGSYTILDPSGSLILGSSDFIKKAKRIRKGLGGGMRQAGILASAGIYALDNLINRLGEDHQNALLIAQELANIHNIDIDIDKVSTNLVFFYLKKNDLSDESFINKLLENKIKIDSKGNRKFRIATHYGFVSDDIHQVINSIKSIVNN